MSLTVNVNITFGINMFREPVGNKTKDEWCLGTPTIPLFLTMCKGGLG